MDEAKRKRLEAKGWRFGSVADFLELSPEESIYIELRLRLSDALKERRKRAGISQAAAADRLRSSQSRVAKMEANDPSVSLDLLITSLIGLGVSLSELGRIMGFEERAPVTVQATAALKNSVLPGQPFILKNADDKPQGVSNAE